ncbi:hypothetical protein A3F03_01835 [Candidatus Roizmanbacteria bacterium RIFCSPHIGHO2_12_FULL_41_11]|uniref:50S ribosomal protein L29 n=3 Tax=Candidatus Roizmaniibacteriota TaxID=1752723 RepID=A0A1F7JQ19_9BACT|nr:MAG: hypothetical protein A3F03_01835 [Candidatus Roizmanbacteria bacterium RIFCSPHIGHO2_12_FULL_41_11]OGK51325.1 MAG: hypothetical protein A2966_04365 [Candidatus Roizmanbacteria bacterium RIFCSPLOWO2_01_FULL_41_22]OGK57701.1 MAG: hypothetical protein A3H86_02225 [Candidatus Roizmanbacteria bacterium RIFCSPLOWO2_02_FULL_41_9]
MKKLTTELNKNTIKELEREIQAAKEEIAKMRLDIKANPPKDTNALMKKRKRLAVSLTVHGQKKDAESNNLS